MRVELADGTTIQVTREHPFYAPDESRYKPIGEFKPREQLARIGRDGKLEAIVVTAIKAVRGEFTVYNMSVDNSHQNYVAAGVLVHNKTNFPPRMPTPDAFSYFEKGRDYYNDSEYQQAINEFTTAIRLDADYAPNYGWRASSYYQLGQYQRAIRDLDKALQLRPKSASTYNWRGLAYRSLGQHAKADADIAKACSLDSKYC